MAENHEKRSIKNLTKTAKYHVLYIGNIMVITLGLAFLLYLVIIHRIVEVVDQDSPEAIRDLIISVSVGALLVAGSIIFVCLLTAHRVSGVHIKLKSTFDRIKHGDLDTRLSFRKGDKLDDVEKSFNDMLESLLARIENKQALSEQEQSSLE